jgi:hypothetical protein
MQLKPLSLCFLQGFMQGKAAGFCRLNAAGICEVFPSSVIA